MFLYHFQKYLSRKFANNGQPSKICFKFFFFYLNEHFDGNLFQIPEHHAVCLEVLFEFANNYDARTN
jgi:hypothetical protein